MLFFFLFAGEYVIPESNPELEWPLNPGFVFPGRADDWSGKPLYTKDRYEKYGASRHFTFIFNTFVLMQIFNMIPSRKINDEWNIFEGLLKNPVFCILFVIIIGG